MRHPGIQLRLETARGHRVIDIPDSEWGATVRVLVDGDERASFGALHKSGGGDEDLPCPVLWVEAPGMTRNGIGSEVLLGGDDVGYLGLDRGRAPRRKVAVSREDA